MVQIEGKYALVKNENFAEYLIGIGIDADKAQKAASDSPDLTVSQDGDEITLHFAAPTERTFKYVLGEEVDEPVGPIMLKSTATLSGDTLTVISQHTDGPTGTRVYKFSDSGLIVTLSSSKPGVPVAVRTYERV